MNAAAPPTAARIPPCRPCTMAAAAVELDADAPEAVGVPELAGVVDEPSDEVAPVEELGDAVEATVTLLEADSLEAAELVELDEEWVVAPVAVLVPVPVEELVAEEQPADVGKSVTPTVAQSSWAYWMVAARTGWSVHATNAYRGGKLLTLLPRQKQIGGWRCCQYKHNEQ
jgi:hypothetical protein